MLRALAAELSDPGRFARAKAYARDGAVVDIEIEPGEVRATIQGSRFEPYVATVFVRPERRPRQPARPDPRPRRGGRDVHVPGRRALRRRLLQARPRRRARAGRRGHDRAGVARPTGAPATPTSSSDRRKIPIDRSSTCWPRRSRAPAPLPELPHLPARLPVDDGRPARRGRRAGARRRPRRPAVALTPQAGRAVRRRDPAREDRGGDPRAAAGAAGGGGRRRP